MSTKLKERDSLAKGKKFKGKETKTITLSPAFSKGKSSSLKDVESEYIKNLQQQIYFLELEAQYLREQAKKATDIHPKMSKEADRMMYKLKDMQSDLDGMSLEVTRKDANISMLTNEKSRVEGDLHATEDNYRREKALLMEQVIELKKMKEVADRNIALRDSEIVNLRQNLERSSAELRHERHSKNIMQSQLEQRVSQHNETSNLLEEKRNECLRKQSDMHYLEEKYNTSTLAIQDKITRDYKEEIRSMRQELRAVEISAGQDRLMKEKMAETVSKLTNENATLHTQVLDLSKQLDHERLMRDEKDSRAKTHTSQITELNGSKQVLGLEVSKLRELLDYERKKFHELEAQMLKTEDGMSSTRFHNKSIQSRLDEVEARYSRSDVENAQLRKDKQILAEHIGQLQKKLDLKSAEVSRLENHLYTLQGDIGTLKSEMERSKSLQSQHWDKMTKTADSLNFQ